MRGVAPRNPKKGGLQFQEMLRQLSPKSTSRADADESSADPPPAHACPGAARPACSGARDPARTSSAGQATAPAKQALAAAIRRAADSAGVEPALSVAVARAESNLDPKAKSSDGLSVGTFQVTHYTKAEMKRKIAAGTVERPPGTDDVALGVGYLRYLHDLFERNTRLAQTSRRSRSTMRASVGCSPSPPTTPARAASRRRRRKRRRAARTRPSSRTCGRTCRRSPATTCSAWSATPSKRRI
jgi:hypothetical protein